LKLLLDTHIWLWSLAQPSRLSRRVQHELTDGRNELWLSPVSTWEALLLHAKRRIHLDGTIRDWVAKATMHMREAPLTHEIVVRAQELPLEHPDPADRFLAATAEVLGLTLVTVDCWA
jgi:PIN domain nuclease of toxin-antitoxin system